MVKSKLSSQLAVPFLGSRLDRNYYSRCWQVSEYSGYARGDVNWFKMTLLKHVPFCEFHLRPYRDEPSASRPIRADKHRRGQRVLTWVTSREHCAAAGFFFVSASSDHLYSHLVPRNPYRFEESCLASFFCPYTTPKGEKDAVQHLLRACGTFYSSTRIQMACNWDWDQCETYLMPRDEVGVSNPAVGTEMKCRANGSRPKKTENSQVRATRIRTRTRVWSSKNVKTEQIRFFRVQNGSAYLMEDEATEEVGVESIMISSPPECAGMESYHWLVDVTLIRRCLLALTIPTL